MSRTHAPLTVCLLVGGALCAPPALAQAPSEGPEATEAATAAEGFAVESSLSQEALERDAVVRRKVRRLRIAGWSFLAGAGVTLGSWLVWQAVRGGGASDDESARLLVADIILGAAAVPALLTTGGALLIRARLVLKRHNRAKRSALSFELTGTGARLRWKF